MMIKLEPASKSMERPGQHCTDAAGDDDVLQMRKKGRGGGIIHYELLLQAALWETGQVLPHKQRVCLSLSESKLSLWPAAVANSDQTV